MLSPTQTKAPSMTENTEEYIVRNRYTGAVQFTAQITCAPNTPNSVKLGMAVKWAKLTRAKLTGANLPWANLSEAKIKDGSSTVTALRGRAVRSDGYEFLIFSLQDGEMIRAGCRTLTLAEFRAHVAAEYPGTPKAAETTRILDFLEAQLSGEACA